MRRSSSSANRIPRSVSSKDVEPMTLANCTSKDVEPMTLANCTAECMMLHLVYRMYRMYTSLAHRPAARIAAGLRPADRAAVAPPIRSECAPNLRGSSPRLSIRYLT